MVEEVVEKEEMAERVGEEEAARARVLDQIDAAWVVYDVLVLASY